MKTIIAGFMMLSLMAVAGCQSTMSPKGGTLSQKKEFTISVPAHTTLKQGESAFVTVALNRSPYFKQDVQLDIKSENIDVTPMNVLIKASELPEARLQIKAAEDAALGMYRVNVKGTPTTGKPTSAEFTVNVVTP
jgi:hypothetical protein